MPRPKGASARRLPTPLPKKSRRLRKQGHGSEGRRCFPGGGGARPGFTLHRGPAPLVPVGLGTCVLCLSESGSSVTVVEFGVLRYLEVRLLLYQRIQLDMQ